MKTANIRQRPGKIASHQLKVPVDPVAWDAPEAPELSGRYAANDDLAEA